MVIYTKKPLLSVSERIKNGKFKTLICYSDNFADEVMEIIERGM